MNLNKLIKTNLIIASKNVGKVKEFSYLLSSLPLNIISPPKSFQAEETGDDFFENAIIKAKAAAKVTGEMSLADDSGLCVKALNGMPGIHSARYEVNDEARINKLLKEIDGISDRNAYFIAALCVVSGNGDVLIEVEGKCHGNITEAPRGDFGFGYDPIFEVNGTGLTFAEMNQIQKQNYSHRGIAFSKLEIEFTRLLKNRL
tara:strand:- start:1836 stop:2441 length:606 start_codon:yes stop_codon:yes gene_type:complete